MNLTNDPSTGGAIPDFITDMSPNVNKTERIVLLRQVED